MVRVHPFIPNLKVANRSLRFRCPIKTADLRIRRESTNSRDFDGWLKANAVLGSILAIGILGMALAALYSAGRPDKSTEFSSVAKPR